MKGSSKDQVKLREKISLADYIRKPNPKDRVNQDRIETTFSENKKRATVPLEKKGVELILPIPEGLFKKKKKHKPSKLKTILNTEYQFYEKLQPIYKGQDEITKNSKINEGNSQFFEQEQTFNDSGPFPKKIEKFDDHLDNSFDPIEEISSNLMNFHVSDEKLEGITSIFKEQFSNKEVYDEFHKYHTSKQNPDKSIIVRNYVDQIIDEELNSYVKNFLSTLSKFQYRLAREQPEKLNRHQRFISGFKQVLKNLKSGNMKLIFIAPNLEPTISKGGIDDLIEQVSNEAKAHDVPLIFALSRSGLRKAVKIGTRHSIIGVLNYEGAEQMVPELLKLVDQRKFDAQSSSNP